AIPRGGAPSSTTNIAQSFRDLTRALIINWRLLTSALRSAKSAFLSTLTARVGGPCCDLLPPLFSGASDECAISSENRASILCKSRRQRDLRVQAFGNHA